MASSIRTKIVTAAVAAAAALTTITGAPVASADILDILGHGLSISAGEESDYVPTSGRAGTLGRSADRDLLRPTAETAERNSSIWPQERYEQVSLEIAEIINEHRAAKGEPRMVLDPAMSRAAQKWAENMARNDFFEHDEATYMGEIIAFRNGIERANTAKAFVQQWENSKPHAKLMHRSDFHVMGVGVAHDPETGRVYAVCRLYWN